MRIRWSPEAVGAAYVASRQGRRTAIAKMANDERDAGECSMALEDDHRTKRVFGWNEKLPLCIYLQSEVDEVNVGALMICLSLHSLTPRYSR